MQLRCSDRHQLDFEAGECLQFSPCKPNHKALTRLSTHGIAITKNIRDDRNGINDGQSKLS